MWGEWSRPSTTASPWFAPLTPRQAQVGQLVAAGLNNTEIAARMGVAKSALEGQISRILRQLDLRTRTDLADWIRTRDPLTKTFSSTP